MSPFANFLRELRLRRGMKQKEVAELLGYEQSYLSSLEKGFKGAPRRAFIDRLIAEMSLDAQEIRELNEVLKLSHRQVFIPASAPAAEYEIWHALRQMSGSLDPDQLSLIKLLLKVMMPKDSTVQPGFIQDAISMERGISM
jgi:transcriptional regulator with XRE-family HTH domain